MRSKSLMGLKRKDPFTSKKSTQGNGRHSKPKKGKKAYRGQGK